MGKLIRYADDFVVISKTYENIIEAEKVIRYFMFKLELTLNKDKTNIVSLWKNSFDFLGHTNRKIKSKTRSGRVYYKLEQYISNKSKSRIKDKIKHILARNTLYFELKDRIYELNQKIPGWRNYYKATSYKRMVQIDKYIAMRLIIWYNAKRQRRKRYQYNEIYRLIRSLGLKYLIYKS